ncbi:MAG TPA: ATP-binding protein [candidate division Zixibacteria bacterium]|nr:ATP-binding protein [candidate division Zixibacteria bacterium]
MSADPTAAEAFSALLRQDGEILLLLVDERLRIIRAGVEAARLAERPVDELPGMSLIAAFGSAQLDGVAREALLEARPARGEADLGRLGQRAFAVEAVPLPSGGLVLALHETTTLRRVERVRRDFVANISHELRTPLSSVKLLAETLSEGGVTDTETARDFAVQIAREVDHLAQLVDELLDLSKIESGETQLTVRPVSPATVLGDVADRIRPVAERRGIAIRIVPAREGGDGRALVDRERIGQALLNLAHNAVKYSHPNGEVRLGWELRGGMVRFMVSDDGIGIPQAHQARIFERFYKVDRSRARSASDEVGTSGSAGLGLAIVRHIAEAHGGAAGVDSTEGVGSTFWVDVPPAVDAGADE